MNKIKLHSTPKIQSNIQVGNLFINPRYTEDIYVLVINPSGGYFAANIRSGVNWTYTQTEMSSAVKGLERLASGTKFIVEAE
jgi:hypothetical protein